MKRMIVDYEPASDVVRAAADRQGKYGATVFNDRLKDGRSEEHTSELQSH